MPPVSHYAQCFLRDSQKLWVILSSLDNLTQSPPFVIPESHLMEKLGLRDN